MKKLPKLKLLIQVTLTNRNVKCVSEDSGHQISCFYFIIFVVLGYQTRGKRPSLYDSKFQCKLK